MGKYLTSRNALIEIGARLRAYRIDYPLSQEELSDKSGISVRSISRLENGEDMQLGNFIKILIALDLDSNLDMLIPDPTLRPSYYVKEAKEPYRKRAPKKSTNSLTSEPKWGDEEK